MDSKSVTFSIMFLFSLILGGKAQQVGGSGPIGNAPSWMSSFQKGPEGGGTLFGLLSAPTTHPSGPEVQPQSVPSHPSDPHSSAVPHPSDPHPPGLEVPPPSDPHPTAPHPSEPISPQASTPHPSDPSATQTQPFPRSFGPGVSPGIAPQTDCERPFCIHKAPEHVHGPLSHDTLV